MRFTHFRSIEIDLPTNSDLFTMADEDFDGDDILDEADGEVETSVQLGFAFDDEKNALFTNPNWREWDGGKIGGQPVWLDPVHLPSPHDLACVHCGSPMTFVLQIYCPLDEITHAFHRSMYVFVCRKKSCVENGSVKCLRCQLPKLNQFYPFNPDDSSSPPKSVGYVGSMPPKLCAVCGQRGAQTCSRCKSINYCSREHQRSHWKFHKLHCGVEASTSCMTDFATLILPEHSLEVSQEILYDRADDALDEAVLKAKIWDDAAVPENIVGDDDDEEDDDAALTQSDYNKALGNEEADPLYTKFMERIRRGGADQVLRYSRWDETEGPLKLSSLALCDLAADKTSVNTATATVSVCPHCGADRKFEFQVRQYHLHIVCLLVRYLTVFAPFVLPKLLSPRSCPNCCIICALIAKRRSPRLAEYWPPWDPSHHHQEVTVLSSPCPPN